MRSNEKGFSPVELILVVLVLVVLGGAGFMVYKNQNKTDDSKDKNAKETSQTKPETEKDTSSPPKQTTPFVNVIQDDGSGIQETPDKIAKTRDQADILTALHKTCTGTSTYVTINHAVFDGNTNYAQDGNHASINALVCDDIVKTNDGMGHSGSRHYLHKNSSGTWVLDLSTQMAPKCETIDGLGYPTSIIETCYDGPTPRAPR